MRTHFPRTGRRLAGLVATLVAAGAASLATGLGTTSEAVAAADDADVADWTMMIYAVGDTASVPQLMVENLTEIAQLPDQDDVNIVVLLDLPEPTDTDAPTSQVPGIGDFSTAKLLVLEDGRYNEIRDLGEVSMGQPDVLGSFIDEAADRYPAKHYGFTFFDHGGGNTGGYVDTGPPGTQELSVPEMREGLIIGMQKAGIDRFDVIDQAACLMANYETVSALAPLGKWLAGSEEIMIYHPLAPASFPPMSQGGDGEDIANAFVQGYVDLLDSIAVQPGGQDYRDLVAMSVVDGDAVANLDAALASFSQAAVANMPEITTAVARARADALEFVAGFPGLEGQSYDLIDLGDFMKHLTGVPDDVAVARDAVSAAIDRAVTVQATGQGTQQATGINVYLPSNPRNVNRSVLGDGTEPQGWGEFVEAFVQSAGSSQGDTGAGVRFVSSQAQILQADASGIKIAAQLTDGSRANVTSAETYVFTGLGGQQSALGLILPAYLDAGGPGQVQGVWNYALTALTDGQDRRAGDGRLPGPVRRPARQLHGAVHRTQRRRQRHRRPGAAQQRGRDPERERRGREHGIQRGRLARDRRHADAVRLRAQLRQLRAGALDAVDPGVRGPRRSTSCGLPAKSPFDMGLVVQDAAGNAATAFASGRVQ